MRAQNNSSATRGLKEIKKCVCQQYLTLQCLPSKILKKTADRKLNLSGPVSVGIMWQKGLIVGLPEIMLSAEWYVENWFADRRNTNLEKSAICFESRRKTSVGECPKKFLINIFPHKKTVAIKPPIWAAHLATSTLIPLLPLFECLLDPGTRIFVFWGRVFLRVLWIYGNRLKFNCFGGMCVINARGIPFGGSQFRQHRIWVVPKEKVHRQKEFNS